MTDVLTSAQMRSLEAAAIASGAVTGLELMERAGRGSVEAIFNEWPELQLAKNRGAAPQSVFCGAKDDPVPQRLDQNESSLWRAVVLCGPGNNGGDGFVVARLLREAGWDVAVYFYGEAARLPADARINCARWMKMGKLHSVAPSGRFDLIVDALFGTGLSRPLPAELSSVVETVVTQSLLSDPDNRAKIVALDILSGLCADSGRALGDRLAPAFAHMTVTFQRRKLGHLLADGAECSGVLKSVDIGLSAGVAGAVALIDQCAPGLAKKAGHKFSHGHALIVSGAIASGGAARLAARGALRIGAGLVTLACPPGALMVNAAHLDAIMLRAVRDAAGMEALLEDARITALCLGPGMGLGAREAGLLGAALQSGRPAVLDADALTMLSQDAGLLDLLHKDCVLTPHAGEFARLFPDIAARLAEPATTGPDYSKVDATRAAAKRLGCVVLFKGPDTVIAAPDGRCAIHAAVYDRMAPWLATAGSGDVLAGFITGLLARGFETLQAAETGAWLHVECARSFGPGLIAEDLPEELPKVFRAMGL